MKKIPIDQQEPPLKLLDGEFGIRTGGEIPITSSEITDVTFKEVGNQVQVKLTLTLTFEETYNSVTREGDVAIGKTNKEVYFNQMGKFKFDKTSSLKEGGLKKLFLVVDSTVKKGAIPNYEGIILKSSNNSFKVKTTAEKIEHGTP